MEASVQLIGTDQGEGSYQDRKLDSNSSQDHQHPMDLSDKGRVKMTTGRDVGGSCDRVVEVPVHGDDAVSRFTEEGHVLSDAVRCETEMLKSVMVEISSAPSVATPSKEDTDKNRDIDTVHEGDMIFTAVPDSALSVSDSTLPLETDEGDSAGITVVETVEVEISDAAEEEMVVPDILEVRVDSDEVEVPVSETVEMEMAVTETVETGVIEECVPMADIEEDVETTPMETETDVEMAPLEMTSTDLCRDETAPTETLPLDLHVQKAPTDLHGNNRTPMQTIPMDLHVERTCAKTTYADPHGGETTPSDSTRVHLHVERTATERTPAYFREDETTPSESAPMDLHVGKSSMEVPSTDVHGDKLPAEPAPIDLHVERMPVETPDLHDRALIQTAPMDLHVERPSSTLHKAGMDTAEDYSIMTAPPAEMNDTYVVNSEKDVGRDQTNSHVASPHRANDDTEDSTTKTEKSKNYRMDVVVVADQSHNVRGVEEGRQQDPPRTHPPAEGVEEIGHDPSAHASRTVRVGKTDSAEGFEEVDVESVEAEEQAKTETMNISRTETNPVDSSEEVDVEICEEEEVEVCEEVEVEKKESADVSRRETKPKDISEEADVEICEDEEEKKEESINRGQGQTIAEDISEEIDIEICEEEEEKKELASLPQQETSTANTPDKMSATVSQGESCPADSLEEIDVETYEEEVEGMTESGDVSQRKTSPADISEEVDIEACEGDMDKKKESVKVSPSDGCGQVDRETFVNEEKVNRESAVNVSQGQTNQNPAEEEVDIETCGNEMEEKKETAKNPDNEISPPEGSGKVEDGSEKVEDGSEKVEDGSEKVEDGSEKVEDGSEKVEVQTCVDQKMRGFSGLDVSQEEVHPADVEVDVKTCDNENKEKKESGYIPQEQTTSADISEDVDIETCEDEDDVKSENIPQDKHRSDKVSLPPITSAKLADTGRPDDALTPEDVPVTLAQEVTVRESNSVSQAGYQQPLEQIPNTSAGEGAEEGPSPRVSQVADPQPAEELSSTSVTTRGEGTHDPADDMRKQGSTQLSGEVRRITSSEASMEDRAPGSPEHDSSLHAQKEEGASLEADSEFSDAKTTSLDKVCRAEGGEDIPVGENLQQSKDISHTNVNTEEEADCPVEVSEEGDIKHLQADSEPATTKPEERPENPADFQAAADAQPSDGISSMQTARLENGSIAANATSEGGGKPIPEDVSISHSRDEIEKHPVEASPPTGPQKCEEAFSSSVIHTEEKETEDSVATPVSNTKEKETEDEDGIVTPITVTEESTENEPECVSKTADTHGLATKAEESTENEPECVSKTADTHGLATKAEESTENEPECVLKTADTHGLATKAEESTENEPECVSKTADTHGLATKAEESTENEPECVSKTADTHGLATKAEESTENEPECVSKTADTHGLATKAEESTENEPECVLKTADTHGLDTKAEENTENEPECVSKTADTHGLATKAEESTENEPECVSKTADTHGLATKAEESTENEPECVLKTADTHGLDTKAEENTENEPECVSKTADTHGLATKAEESTENEPECVSKTADTHGLATKAEESTENEPECVSKTADTHGLATKAEESTENEPECVLKTADTHGLDTKAEENTENEPECVSKTADTHGLATKEQESTENEPECVSKTADTHGLATKAEESTENEPECVSKTADTHGLATKAEESTENEPECVSKTADTHGLATKAEESTENEPECVSKTADTHGLATKAEESTENEPECVSKTADTHGLATKAEENTENELVDVVSETADLQIGGDSVCASVPDTEEGTASTEVVSETTDTQLPGEIASVSVMNSEENLEQELDVVSETANTQSHGDVSSMSVMNSEENREQELDVVSETANTQSHRAVSVSVMNIEGNMEQDVSETANTHGDVSNVSVMNSEENIEQEVDVVSVSASASAPSPTGLSTSLTSNREECVVDEQVDVVSVTRDTQIMEDHSEVTSTAKDNKDAELEEAILKSTHTQPSEDKLNVPSTNTDGCVENELVVSETSDPQIMEDFSKLPSTSESEPVEAVSETTHTQLSEDKSRVVDDAIEECVEDVSVTRDSQISEDNAELTTTRNPRESEPMEAVPETTCTQLSEDKSRVVDDAIEECVEDVSVTRDSQISEDNAELTTTRDPRESEPMEAVPETTCTQLSEDKSRVVDDAIEECVEDVVSVTRDSQISEDNADLTTTRDPRESEPVEVFETAHSHSQLSGDTSSATPVTEERVENDPVNVDLVTRDTQISEDKSKSRTSTEDHVESGLTDHISVTADKQCPEDKSNAQTTNREDCMGNEPTDVALGTADTQISEDVSRLPATTTENEPVDVTSDKAELSENVSNAPNSNTVRCVDNEAADSIAKTAVEKTFEGTHGTTSADPCVENESVDVRSETISPSTIDISSALDTRVVEDEECEGVDVTDTKNQDISENMSNIHVNNNNIDMETSQVELTSDTVEIEHMEERIPKDAETDFPKTSDAGEIEHMEERIPKDAETDFPKAATSSESSNPETATEAVKDGSTLEESEFRASADLTDTHEVSTIQEDSGVDVDSNPSDSKSELHTVFVDSSGQETVETSLAAISPTASDEKNNEGDVESSVFKMQTYASSNALPGSTEDISPVTVGQINSMISRPEKESTASSGREASPILHSEGVAAPEELGTAHEVKTDDKGEENDKNIHMQETRPEKEKIQLEKDDRNEIVVKHKGTVDISVNDTPVNHGGEENDDIILNANREDPTSPKPEKSEVFVSQNEETAGKKQGADSKCRDKDVQVDKSNKGGTVSSRPAKHKRVDNIFEKFTPLRQRHLEPVVYLGRRADDKTVDRKTSHACSCSGRTLPQSQVDLREENKDEEKSDVYSSDSSSEDEGDADDHTDKVVEEDDRDDEAPKSRRHERDQLSMPPDTDEKAKDTQQFKNTGNAGVKSDKTGNKEISTLDDEDSDDVNDEDSDDVNDTQLTGSHDKTVRPSQNTEASSAKKDLVASLSNSTVQQGESLEDGRSFEKDEHSKNPLLGSAKHDNNSVPDKGDDITNLDLSDNESFSSDGGEEDDIIEDDAEDSKSRNEDNTKIHPDMSVFDIKNRQTPNTEDKTESNVENNSNGAAGKDVRKSDSGDDLNKKPSTSESDLDKSESDDDFAEDPSTPQFQFSRSKTLKTYTRKSAPAGVEQERMTRPEIPARPILHMKTYSRKSEPALADPIDSDSSDSDDMEMSRNSERNFRNSRRWENGDGGQDFPEHQWKVETVRLGEDSTKTKPSIVSRITKALTSASRDLSRGRMLTSVPFDSRKEGTLTSDESKTVALVPASRKRRRGRTTWSIRLKKRRSSRPEKVDSKGEGESVENEFELAHKCITCNTAFPTPGRLRKHQMQHEAGRHFYCDVCGKLFETQERLDIHKQIHLQSHSGVFTCPHCGKQCRSWRPFTYHLNTHRTDGGKKHSCEICGHTLFSLLRLKKHMKHHSRGLNFCCFICGKLFLSQAILDKHSTKHPGRSAEIPVKVAPSLKARAIKRARGKEEEEGEELAIKRPAVVKGRATRKQVQEAALDTKPASLVSVSVASDLSESEAGVEESSSPAEAEKPKVTLSLVTSPLSNSSLSGGGEVRKSSRKRSHSRKRCTCCPTSPTILTSPSSFLSQGSRQEGKKNGRAEKRPVKMEKSVKNGDSVRVKLPLKEDKAGVSDRMVGMENLRVVLKKVEMVKREVTQRGPQHDVALRQCSVKLERSPSVSPQKVSPDRVLTSSPKPQPPNQPQTVPVETPPTPVETKTVPVSQQQNAAAEELVKTPASDRSQKPPTKPKRPSSEPFQGRKVKIYRTASEKLLPKNLALSNPSKERVRRVEKEKQEQATTKAEKPEEKDSSIVSKVPKLENKSYPCRICGESFRSDSDMKIHVGKHLTRSSPTQAVDIETVARSCQLASASTSPEKQGYSCHRCGFHTQAYADLSKHMWMHSQKRHQCAECCAAFTNADTLQLHMKAHKKGKARTK